MLMHNPPHPGKVRCEFLGDIDVSTAAKHLKVSRATLLRVLNGEAGISADMSLRLSVALGTHAEIWYELQTDSDRVKPRNRNCQKSIRSTAQHKIFLLI